MQDAASSLHRAVRESEDAGEERLANAVRLSKRENDRLQADLADAHATHEHEIKVCWASSIHIATWRCSNAAPCLALVCFWPAGYLEQGHLSSVSKLTSSELGY